VPAPYGTYRILFFRSTHGLEVPLSDDAGHLLVSTAYIAFCLDKANAKLLENFTRIDKFEEQLCGALFEKSPLEAETLFMKRTRTVVENKPDEGEEGVITVVEDACDIFQDFSFLNQDL